MTNHSHEFDKLGSASGRDVETTFNTASASKKESMEKALWYLFAGSRGGTNRVRIVRALIDRPQNANELADELDVDYNTITHHLDMLEEHDVVEPSEHDYGKLYFLTDQFEIHQETFDEIAGKVK